MKLRGIPGNGNAAQAAHAAAARSKRTAAPRLPPTLIEKPADPRVEDEGGQVPGVARKVRSAR